MVEILNNTSELNYAYSDNQLIQSLASIIYRAADFAHQCSAENMYEAAYKLSDFCESILDIGVQTGIIFAATALEAAEILTEGVTQGLENSFNYFEKWCTKPKESTIDHLKTAYLLCDTLGAILAAPTEVALFAFEAECQASGQKIACNKHDQISAAIAKHFENKSVKEVLTEIVALGTENIATAKVFMSAGKFLGELGTAIKIEAGPATAIMANKTSDAIPKIKATQTPALVTSNPQLTMPSFELIKSKDEFFTPITKIVKEAGSRFQNNVSAINQIKKEHGQEVLDIVLKLIKEEPAVLQGNDLQTLLNPKIPKIENLNYRKVRPKDDLYAFDKWANEQYTNIRNSVDDVGQIAKNTGFTKQSIQKIKNHIFFKKHILRDNKFNIFDADEEIASAWNRLKNGDFIKNDLHLLGHELLEDLVELNFNLDYENSHEIAKKFFNWQAPNN